MDKMRRFSEIGTVVLALVMAALLCTGYGRRGALERFRAAQTETVTMELQPLEAETAMPAPDSTAIPQQANISPAQTATPNASSHQSDSQTSQLIEELETVLDELDTAISKADQDALTDVALTALGK